MILRGEKCFLGFRCQLMAGRTGPRESGHSRIALAAAYTDGQKPGRLNSLRLFFITIQLIAVKKLIYSKGGNNDEYVLDKVIRSW